MSPGTSSLPPECPECGAVLPQGATECLRCRTPRAAHGGSPDSAAFGNQYSLATLLLVVTLVAVYLAALRVHLGLGLVLIGLSVPALLRSVATNAYEKRRGKRLTAGEKLAVFIESLTIVVVVLLLSGVLLLTACAAFTMLFSAWAGMVGNHSEEVFRGALALGMLFGTLGGLWLFSHLMRLTWPGAEGRKRHSS